MDNLSFEVSVKILTETCLSQIMFTPFKKYSKFFNFIQNSIVYLQVPLPATSGNVISDNSFKFKILEQSSVSKHNFNSLISSTGE